MELYYRQFLTIAVCHLIITKVLRVAACLSGLADPNFTIFHLQMTRALGAHTPRVLCICTTVIDIHLKISTRQVVCMNSGLQCSAVQWAWLVGYGYDGQQKNAIVTLIDHAERIKVHLSKSSLISTCSD